MINHSFDAFIVRIINSRLKHHSFTKKNGYLSTKVRKSDLGKNFWFLCVTAFCNSESRVFYKRSLNKINSDAYLKLGLGWVELIIKKRTKQPRKFLQMAEQIISENGYRNKNCVLDVSFSAFTTTELDLMRYKAMSKPLNRGFLGGDRNENFYSELSTKLNAKIYMSIKDHCVTITQKAC